MLAMLEAAALGNHAAPVLGKRTRELEKGQGCLGRLILWHDSAVTHWNSQQLWLPGQDLYKPEPVNISHGGRRRSGS